MYSPRFAGYAAALCLVALSAMSLNCAGPVDPPALSTGRSIEPSATQPAVLPGMPMTMVASADGRFAVVSGMGYTESLYVLSTADGRMVDQVQFSNRAAGGGANYVGGEDTGQPQPTGRTNGLYYGLAIDDKGTVYAGQGANNTVAVLTLSPAGELIPAGLIEGQPGDFPAGVSLDGQGRLYVANNSAGGGKSPIHTPGGMAIYDTASKKELGRFLFDSPLKTSNFPLAVAALRDGSKAYVASERDGMVYALDTSDPAHPALISAIPTGAHPVSLLLNHYQSRLFVANSESDTISVIDTAADKAVGTVLLRPDTIRGLGGVTPTGLSLSPDEKTLYAALSDMNAVGVVDVGTLTLRGMIPAGWYPSAVIPVAGNQLLAINAKGNKTRNPNAKYNPFGRPPNWDQYVLNAVQGSSQLLPIPTDSDLAALTEQALSLSHVGRITQPPSNSLAAIGIKAGKIKHIIYIVKENRTYDQVLGDVPGTDGDPSLVLFGRNVTPNLHSLAERFVRLDNTYACGEVSGDGWVWSTQSTANAYVIRNIPYNYSGRGRTYDTEGENNGYITGGFPANDPDGKPLSTNPAYRHGAPAIPDVAESAPHLWDLARDAGLSYRNYGFFLSTAARGGGGEMPENYPTVAGLQPPGHDLAGKSDMDFRQFDLEYPDSDAPKTYFDQTTDKNCLYRKTAFGKYNSPSRFSEWNREFQEMLARDPSGDSVPALMLVRMGHDHTQGTSPGRHTPASEVADNDYGVGQLVDAISHSPIWDSSAVFVIEDDAQAGPDHVDCHRTTAYVISPWLKRGSLDHDFHNTDSLLRTMEVLLDLPPMSQYDAISEPIQGWDTSPSNSEPFNAILPPKEIIGAINPSFGGQRQRPAAAVGMSPANSDEAARMAAASEQMDFIHADAAPADELNQIIWKSVRGTDSVMPAPRHSLASPLAPTKANKPADDDD